jgi:hypothetical protein
MDVAVTWVHALGHKEHDEDGGSDIDAIPTQATSPS